jgi:SecD/SecF fusion protein
VFGSAEAKIFGNDNQLKITTKYKVEEHGIEADQEVNKLLFQSLKQHFAADLTYDKFINAYPGKVYGVVQASKVGPTVRISKQCILGCSRSDANCILIFAN